MTDPVTVESLQFEVRRSTDAVRACISQLRRMAEDMLATAAMLENGIEREKIDTAADAYDNARYKTDVVGQDGPLVRIEDLDEDSQAALRQKPIVVPVYIMGFKPGGEATVTLGKQPDDRGLCVPPDVLEREGIKP